MVVGQAQHRGRGRRGALGHLELRVLRALPARSEKKLTGLSSSFVARSQKTSGIGRLMVQVIEATELKACKPNGKCFSCSTDVVTALFFAGDSSEH